MIKLIAVDIDGTMTLPNRSFDLPAIEAVRKAEASGLKVSLATGNVLCYAEAAATLAGTSGPIIAEDGGVVFNRKDDRRILGDAALADKGLDALRKEFDIEETWSSRLRLAGRTLKRTISSEEIMKVFEREKLELNAVDSGFAIHIKTPNVHKGNAIKELASMTGLKLDEIAAIGDGANDVQMLKIVGVSFCPGSAQGAAKKVVSRVMRGAHGVGVSEAIDEILGLESRD